MPLSLLNLRASSISSITTSGASNTMRALDSLLLLDELVADAAGSLLVCQTALARAKESQGFTNELTNFAGNAKSMLN
jgi:hypothetical protein